MNDISIRKSHTTKKSGLLSETTSLDYLMFFYIVAFVGISYFLSYFVGQSGRFQIFLYKKDMLTLTSIALGFLICFRLVYIMVARRPKRLFRYVWRDFKQNVFTAKRMKTAALPFFTYFCFLGAFTSMKSLIPVFNPFCWDAMFFELDRTIHFGVDPWRITHAAFGHPIVTCGINIFYNIWFFVMIGVLYWQMFSLKNPKSRMQFLYSFFLVWTINGVLIATILSSAGPCYYARATGQPNQYQEMRDNLHACHQEYPIWALKVQDYLWLRYEMSETRIGSGISAMPSLHVSIVVLLFLIGMRTSRRMGLMFGAYALIIMIGSVHLGWHYAVDGYLSIILTLIIWHVSGLICNRFAPDHEADPVGLNC